MTEKEQIHSEPKIYLEASAMDTTNQTVLRKNYLAEFLSLQAQTNQAFSKSVVSMNEKLEETSSEQHDHYLHLLSKLQEQESMNEHLKTGVQLNDLNNKDVIQRLSNLESINEQVGKVLEEEKMLSQATIDQLSFQEDLTRKIHTKLEDYEKLYLDIQIKMNEQESFYQQINDKLVIQDMFHQTIIERMDKQDVNSQKMVKQIDSIGDALVDKIESAIQSIETKYKQTLHYLGSFFHPKERVIHKIPVKNEKKQVEIERVKQD
jgi:hypothetical protein